MTYAPLQFDPAALIAHPAATPLDRSFLKWVIARQAHHDYAELEDRLAAVAANLGDDLKPIFLYDVWWQTWRAATWKPPSFTELESTTKNRTRDLLDGKSSPEDLFSAAAFDRMQYGCFIYTTGKPEGKQLPSVATLFAAQIAAKCQVLKAPIDWNMPCKLISVAGIESDADPSSLQVSARKLLRAIDSKKLALVGWPQDVGTTADAVSLFLTLARGRPPLNG